MLGSPGRSCDASAASRRGCSGRDRGRCGGPKPRHRLAWQGHCRGAMRDCHSLAAHPRAGWFYEGGWAGGAISSNWGASWSRPYALVAGPAAAQLVAGLASGEGWDTRDADESWAWRRSVWDSICSTFTLWPPPLLRTRRGAGMRRRPGWRRRGDQRSRSERGARPHDHRESRSVEARRGMRGSRWRRPR
jgi:hypothetical protein